MIYTTAIVVSCAFAAATVFLLVYSFTSRAAQTFTPPEQMGKQRPGVTRRPYFWQVLIKRANIFVPNALAKDLDKKIVMAGGLQGATAAEIVLYSFVGALVALGAGILIIAVAEWSPWLVVLACFAGAILPFVWLRDQVKKRHLEILRDMPFHLDLLTLSVEAGLDFGAAVARMVEKGRPGPLREEFTSFLGEIRMGKTRAESMNSMSERVGLPALSNFLAALIQADKLGSGLGRTLRLQSEQLRVERFQRAEKLAGEAPVKMLLPLVVFIFPTIWIILAAPLIFEWIFKGTP